MVLMTNQNVQIVLVVLGVAVLIGASIASLVHSRNRQVATESNASGVALWEAINRIQGKGIIYPRAAQSEEDISRYDGRVTISHNYYEAPLALRTCLANYWAAPEKAKSQVVLQIVDDGSSKHPATEVYKEFVEDYGDRDAPFEVRVVTLEKDVGFNVAGARNTGVEAAPTDVVVFGDIDYSPAPSKLASLVRGAPGLYSDPTRVYYVPGHPVGDNPTTMWMVHRLSYRAMGGNDEDFSGRYGNEENHFVWRALNGVMAKVMPHPFYRYTEEESEVNATSDDCSSCAMSSKEKAASLAESGVLLEEKKRTLGPNRSALTMVRVPWHVDLVHGS